MQRGRRIKAPPTTVYSARETRPLCGCALSRTFPFCDGSQMISKTNAKGQLVSCGATTAKQPEAEAQA